jgi:hypothetical protein
VITAGQGQQVTLEADFFAYGGGPAADVTNLTVHITTTAGVTIIGPTNTGITHIATGIYTYTWAIPLTLTPGDYVVAWVATQTSASEIVTVLSATVYPLTPFLLGSYITCEEYRAAPTALNTNNLVPGAPQTDQDNELAGIIARSSRWIDNTARQALYATQSSQSETARVDGTGAVILKARQDRVKSIDAFAYGPVFTQLNTLSTPISRAQYFIEENRTLLSLTTSGVQWTGGLSFLAQPRNGDCVVQWTLTAGWVTTRLAAPAAQGATSVQVELATGILPGLFARIVAGDAQANVQVATTYTPGSTTVALTSGLAAAQPAGAWFGEVPDDIKEASILATSHYIKERKGAGFTIGSKSSNTQTQKEDIGIELIQAEEIALRYERRNQ